MPRTIPRWSISYAAIILTTSPLFWTAPPPPPGRRSMDDHATLRVASAGNLTVSTSCVDRRYMVVSEVWHPGWLRYGRRQAVRTLPHGHCTDGFVDRPGATRSPIDFRASLLGLRPVGNRHLCWCAGDPHGHRYVSQASSICGITQEKHRNWRVVLIGTMMRRHRDRQ